MSLAVVVAVDEDRGIGKAKDLPWRIPDDMAHFRELTRAAEGGKQNAVLMGRTTWESIPERFRPLPGRINVVLTRRGIDPVPEAVLVAASFDEALEHATRSGAARSFAIGGALVYAEALERQECTHLYITRVQGNFDCDTFFPPWQERFELAEVLGEGVSGGHAYRIEVWQRR